MTQKPELYRPVASLSKINPEQEVAFTLIARVLRLMKSFNMKSQNNISQGDVANAAARLLTGQR